MRNFVGGGVIGLVMGVVLALIVPRADRDLPKSGPINPSTNEQPAPPDKINWRMASAFGSDLTGFGDLATGTVTRLATMSDGEITLEFHEPGALVPALELFDAVSSGAIEAAFASPIYWADKQPALQLFGAIPFGPDLREYLAWFRLGGGREVYEEIYHRRNLHGIVCGVSGPAGAGWFQRPIDKIGDLADLRIAAVGLTAQVLKTVGAIPIRLAPGDQASAFERGAIDAASFSNPTTDQAAGIHRHARHYYFPGWFQQLGVVDLLIHLPQWTRLSNRQKSLIQSACDANIARSLAASEAGQFELLKSLILQGIDVRRWSPELLAALKAGWTRVVAAESAADPDFAKVWKSLKTFRRDYAIWRELGDL